MATKSASTSSKTTSTPKTTSTTTQKTSAASSTAAKSSPSYSITVNGKTQNLTAAQISGLSAATKAALASQIQSGAAKVSSGGKAVNLFGSTTQTNKAVTPTGTANSAPASSNKSTVPTAAVGSAYAAPTASDSKINSDTAKAAAAKMTAMQKGSAVPAKLNPNEASTTAGSEGISNTYQAPNGKQYDIVKNADGTVSFASNAPDVYGKTRTFSNEAEALAEIDKNNAGQYKSQYVPSELKMAGEPSLANSANDENRQLVSQQTKGMEGATDINEDFTRKQEASQAEQNQNINQFQQQANIDQSALNATNTQRQADIQSAKDKMLANNNIINETSQRLIRLQSNEHLDTLMKQYISKGMTEEEARAQAQNDMEGQLQKERQTLLQAQKDNAELNNQVTQWGANASDIISQGKESNIKINTANAQTVMNAQNAAETAAQSAENQSYVNTIQSMGLDNFKTLNDIEKQKVMNTLGINQADSDKRYAAETFINTMGSYASKYPSKFAAMLKAINSGNMTLQQAQAGLFGSSSSSSSSGSKTASNTVKIGNVSGVSPW